MEAAWTVRRLESPRSAAVLAAPGNARAGYYCEMLSRRDALAALVAPALCGQDRRSSTFDDAESYERFMGRWSRLLAPLFVDFTDFRDTGLVLDAGAGTGALALSIARSKLRCQVVGIDPSKEYVEFATKRNAFPGRVSFQVGDAQQIRFPGATFQTSLSLLVFNFIPDGKKALRELRRVTKPGGRISAAVWDYGAGMQMLRVFWDAAVTVDPTAGKFDQMHMPLCRAGELVELWKQCGLAHVAERPLEITMRFESFADYWDPFLLGQGSAGNFLRNLDGDRRGTLRSELKRRLVLKSEEVPFSLTARAWAVRGTVPNQ